jgi:hypothetical protein
VASQRASRWEDATAFVRAVVDLAPDYPVSEQDRLLLLEAATLAVGPTPAGAQSARAEPPVPETRLWHPADLGQLRPWLLVMLGALAFGVILAVAVFATLPSRELPAPPPPGSQLTTVAKPTPRAP